MPLSKSVPRRQVHELKINFETFLRQDGLWDIEAHMTDTRMHEITSDFYPKLEAGKPYHDMWVRLTLDSTMEVKAIEVVMDRAPFGQCPKIVGNYQKLMGARIGNKWLRRVVEAGGGCSGCTHINGILQYMGNVAFQGIMTELTSTNQGYPVLLTEAQVAEALINSCHSWEASTAIVREYLPSFQQPKQ